MLLAGFRKRQDRIFILTVLLCWIWINLWIALRYEPWRDVAQSWMIVRQLSLPEMFWQLKNEGHPCLWFLLLFPLAKLSLPFYSILILSFLLVLAGLFMFLLIAPLSRTFKLAVVFSAMGMYYLPVISRNYALIPLLLMLVYSCYPKRLQRPIRYAVTLALLCQTHVLLFGLVCALSLLWSLEAVALWRRRRDARRAFAASAAIVFGSIAFLVWQLNGGIGINKELLQVDFQSLSELLRSVLNALSLDGVSLTTIQLYDRGNTVWMLVLVPLALFCTAIWILWILRAPRSAAAFLAAVVWHIGIHVYVYQLTHMQHFLTLLWMMLFCILLAVGELKERKPARARISNQSLVGVLTAATLAVVLLSCARVYSDILTECSDEGVNSKSIETAGYINFDLPEDSVVLIDNEIMATPVAALCGDGKLYNPIRHNGHIFALYDQQSEGWCAYGDLDAEIETLHASGVSGALYLLVDVYAENDATSMSERSASSLELVRRFEGKTVRQEQYLLYRIVESD